MLQLLNNGQLSDAIILLNDLGLSNIERARETLDRIITAVPPRVNDYHQQTRTTFHLTNSEISKRMTPVSAGCDDYSKSYGLWVSPIYSRGIKRTEGGVSGYRSKAQGMVFWIDTLINDTYLVGLYYGQIYDKLTYRNLKYGDNTKGLTNIFSLYGAYNEPSSPWFTEGVLSYANTRIKDRSGRRIYNGNIETALGKYKSRAYSGQVIEGYNFNLANGLMLSPVAGLRYSYFRDASYQETGTRFQNLLMKGKSYGKFEGILGFRTSGGVEFIKLALMPELHDYLDYNFTNKRSPTIAATIQGISAPLATKQYKTSRALYTIGGSLTTKYRKVELGVGFDAFLAKKYYAYQGSLKVRANF
ncbi:MAG: autotransporter outer membrane beta-barrel domain-containing protein [Candidatus Rickettsia vulgarisii]